VRTDSGHINWILYAATQPAKSLGYRPDLCAPFKTLIEAEKREKLGFHSIKGHNELFTSKHTCPACDIAWRVITRAAGIAQLREGSRPRT
jgi:hypothetical protein